MANLTRIDEVAAAPNQTGELVVIGFKGPDGERHEYMQVDAARLFVQILMTAIEQADANAAGAEPALRGPLLGLKQWTVMPGRPGPERLLVQFDCGNLVANYPLSPEDARNLAKDIWAGADRTDGGSATLQ